MYALQNIERGTEITISYGPDIGHNRDFVCPCDKSTEERQKRFTIICKLAESMGKRNELFIQKQICEYLESVIAKKILFYHYL